MSPQPGTAGAGWRPGGRAPQDRAPDVDRRSGAGALNVAPLNQLAGRASVPPSRINDERSHGQPHNGGWPVSSRRIKQEGISGRLSFSEDNSAQAHHGGDRAIILSAAPSSEVRLEARCDGHWLRWSLVMACHAGPVFWSASERYGRKEPRYGRNKGDTDVHPERHLVG